MWVFGRKKVWKICKWMSNWLIGRKVLECVSKCERWYICIYKCIDREICEIYEEYRDKWVCKKEWKWGNVSM